MQKRKTKGLWLGPMTLILCAILGVGIISAALAADGGGSVSVGFYSNGGWATSSDGPALYQPGDVAYVDDLGDLFLRDLRPQRSVTPGLSFTVHNNSSLLSAGKSSGLLIL